MLPLPGLHGTIATTLAAFASTALDRWALRRIQQTVPGAAIRFALWDGFSLTSGSTPPVASHPLQQSWCTRELGLGPRAELRRDCTCPERSASRATWSACSRRSTGGSRIPSGAASGSREDRTTSRARAYVHRHYDLGNRFYQCWLDREMVYTCAYFPKPGTTLEDAQVAKMDRICRKLQLRRGERVIEAGLRLGRAGALHGPPVRCLGNGVQPVCGADRLRTRARP